MKTTTLKVNKDIKFLSELYDELPNNVIFNKGATGAGGTTIALNEDRNTIICVPFVSLIQNKIFQVENDTQNFYKYPVLGVYGGVKPQQIINFINDNTPYKKIMVTYDSLDKLKRFIDFSDYHILIDEFHILSKHYSFRNPAIKSVLSNYKSFKSFTFMSATPVKKEYILDELEDTNVLDLEWLNSKEVVFTPTKCKNVEKTSAKIILDFLGGKQLLPNTNLHIFCNSVQFIEKMTKLCNLNENNTRVVYSKNNASKVTLPNSLTTDAVKRINMYTSTTFEGADIYDENGVILVVSDGAKEHTLLDITTDLPQIAGRIRNSKYLDKITHLYSTNQYLDKKFISAEDYKNYIFNLIESQKEYLPIINNPRNMFTDQTLRTLTTLTFLRYDESAEKYIVDTNRIKLEVRAFEILRGVYRTKVSLMNEYQNNSLKVVEGVDRNDYINIPVITDCSNIKEYCDKIKQTTDQVELDLILLNINEEYPWFLEAYYTLGLDKIEELNYHKSNILKAVAKVEINESIYNNDYKIVKYLDEIVKLKNGQFISAKDSKNLFKKIYNELNINITAKGSDLEKYFVTETASRRLDGVKTLGYVIVDKKIKIK